MCERKGKVKMCDLSLSSGELPSMRNNFRKPGYSYVARCSHFTSLPTYIEYLYAYTNFGKV